MPRPTIASLSLLASSLLAACSGTTHAPAQPTNKVATARYSLFPLYVRGSEGMHSASHSSTDITGVLSITGGDAQVVLDFDTFIGFVHCPEEMRTGKVFTMQQCADESQQSIQHQRKVTMRGTARTENGTLVVSVVGEQDQRDKRIQPSRLSLTCHESYLGFSCAIGDQNLWSFGVFVPHALAFLSPGLKRFTLAPTDVKDVGSVSGTLAIADGGKVEWTLAVDGGAPTTLPGRTSWQDHGIHIQAQTSPTRTISANCSIDGEHLKCEVTGDRSVLGKPEHIYSEMVLVPEREAVPAHDPMRAPMQAPLHAPMLAPANT